MKNFLFLKADSENVSISIWNDNKSVVSKEWLAGRELSTQILTVVEELCSGACITLDQIEGIVVYEGPGSYTGLRISISVANALAFSLSIPVIGSNGDDWLGNGLIKIKKANNSKLVLPIYGGEVYITNPKK